MMMFSVIFGLEIWVLFDSHNLHGLLYEAADLKSLYYCVIEEKHSFAVWIDCGNWMILLKMITCSLD